MKIYYNIFCVFFIIEHKFSFAFQPSLKLNQNQNYCQENSFFKFIAKLGSSTDFNGINKDTKKILGNKNNFESTLSNVTRYKSRFSRKVDRFVEIINHNFKNNSDGLNISIACLEDLSRIYGGIIAEEKWALKCNYHMFNDQFDDEFV